MLVRVRVVRGCFMFTAFLQCWFVAVDGCSFTVVWQRA